MHLVSIFYRILIYCKAIHFQLVRNHGVDTVQHVTPVVHRQPVLLLDHVDGGLGCGGVHALGLEGVRVPVHLLGHLVDDAEGGVDEVVLGFRGLGAVQHDGEHGDDVEHAAHLLRDLLLSLLRHRVALVLVPGLVVDDEEGAVEDAHPVQLGEELDDALVPVAQLLLPLQRDPERVDPEAGYSGSM